MAFGQIGIFALGDAAHGFFEFSLREGAGIGDVVRALADVRVAHTTIGGLNSVVGFRPELWRSIGQLPDDVHGFNEALAGPDGFTMPATQADAFVWYSGASYDSVFDAGLDTIGALASLAKLQREQQGWVYRHNRDLTGFEDGTKNPSLYDAPGIALIPAGKPGAGGSVLLFQQWRHDPAWRGLAQERQEKIIGRTKPGSVEFASDVMPSDSHVQRTTLDENGVELKIFRRNVPYGTASDHGTLFIGFAAEQHRLQDMLKQMAGIGGPRDALTRFTAALTGAYYFCPSNDALGAFATKDDDD